MAKETLGEIVSDYSLGTAFILSGVGAYLLSKSCGLISEVMSHLNPCITERSESLENAIYAAGLFMLQLGSMTATTLIKNMPSSGRLR